jgi:Fe-S cluster biogenesis protein NfuA
MAARRTRGAVVQVEAGAGPIERACKEVAGLSHDEAEDLLDWLENRGGLDLDVRPGRRGGFSVRFRGQNQPRAAPRRGAARLVVRPLLRYSWIVRRDRARQESRMSAPQVPSLKERVVRALAEEVGPALELDGTAIEVLDVTDGVARVRLGGVCGGCPSTLMTIVMGLEQELRRHVPEVEYLEAVP